MRIECTLIECTINPLGNTIFVQRALTPVLCKKATLFNRKRKKHVPLARQNFPRIGGEKKLFRYSPFHLLKRCLASPRRANVTEGAGAFCQVSDTSSGQVFALPFVWASQPPGFRPLRKNILRVTTKRPLQLRARTRHPLLVFGDG